MQAGTSLATWASPIAPARMKVSLPASAFLSCAMWRTRRSAEKGAPDVIMLDHFSRDMLREAVRRVGASPFGRPVLEASGGVTLETVRSIAETGVHYISVGTLTHSAPALDLSLTLHEL